MRSPPPRSMTRRRMVLVPMSMVATRTSASRRRHRAPVDRGAGAAIDDMLIAGAVGIGEVDARPARSVRRESQDAAIGRPGRLLVVALVLGDARELPVRK